jgi:hypothetical protein
VVSSFALYTGYSNLILGSWIAVTPESSDDEQPFVRQRPASNPIITPDLSLAVEGLSIHEHEESFPSDGEGDDDDISVPPSDDSSIEDEETESSDEETILAPRTVASLARHVVSDEALRARYYHHF